MTSPRSPVNRRGAVIPAAIMSSGGRYGAGWKRWVLDHNYGILRFLQEGLRRRRLLGVDLEERKP